ncbi:hypothetical protein Ancab_027483 [Ancistrocladus abbreviatus]
MTMTRTSYGSLHWMSWRKLVRIQHLARVFVDNCVENFAPGAWQALGSAWRGGSNFIQKLEHSAVNLTESIQQGGPAGSVAPSLLETGRAFTAKGMQVLENIWRSRTVLRSWKCGPTIMHYYLTERKQNYHWKGNLFMRVGLKKSRKFLI